MKDGFGAYRSFIDALVDVARNEVFARRTRDHGHSERTNDVDLPLDHKEQVRKNLFIRLNSEDRETFAELLENVRMEAIHDLASFLEFAVSSDGFQINWKGERVPASPYISMHADFYSRFYGDTWEDLGAK
jgi:hypothetical protein